MEMMTLHFVRPQIRACLKALLNLVLRRFPCHSPHAGLAQPTIFQGNLDEGWRVDSNGVGSLPGVREKCSNTTVAEAASTCRSPSS